MSYKETYVTVRYLELCVCVHAYIFFSLSLSLSPLTKQNTLICHNCKYNSRILEVWKFTYFDCGIQNNPVSSFSILVYISVSKEGHQICICFNLHLKGISLCHFPESLISQEQLRRLPCHLSKLVQFKLHNTPSVGFIFLINLGSQLCSNH